MIRGYLFLRLTAISACLATGAEAIIGGHKGVDSQYQVSLQHNNKHFCGGGIHTNFLILTAASCFLNRHNNFRNRSAYVVAGSESLQRPYPQYVVTHKIKTVYIPTDFQPNVSNVADIAVLKLHEALQLGTNRKLASLLLGIKRGPFQNHVGKTARITGYGVTHINFDDVTESNGTSDGYIRYADAVVLHPSDFHYRIGTHVDAQICARIKPFDDGGKRGTCTGDAGGPLVYEGMVIGILSQSPLGCSEEYYGASYTRVAYYLTFIANVKSNRGRTFIREIDLK